MLRAIVESLIFVEEKLAFVRVSAGHEYILMSSPFLPPLLPVPSHSIPTRHSRPYQKLLTQTTPTTPVLMLILFDASSLSPPSPSCHPHTIRSPQTPLIPLVIDTLALVSVSRSLVSCNCTQATRTIDNQHSTRNIPLEMQYQLFLPPT